jgi:hypothetical protein
MTNSTGSNEVSGGEGDLISEFIERERAPHREPRVRVTGLLVQYYHVCKRELWFTSRGIDIDRGAANIRRGTHIDETSYRDKRRSFHINGRIALDMLDSGEVMKSRPRRRWKSQRACSCSTTCGISTESSISNGRVSSRTQRNGNARRLV